MKVLIASERYYPSVGGVQTVTRLLAEALVQAGQDVTVVTSQEGEDGNACEVRVLRRPGAFQMLREYKTADGVILQGLTLRLGWPVLWGRCPAVVVHHLQTPSGGTSVGRYLRARLGGRVRHAAVSEALARELAWQSEAILPNPYEAKVFRPDQRLLRTRDVVFVGRLIPQKGVSVLVEALALLCRRGCLASATLVGDGPEKPVLEEMVKAKGLQHGVIFAGEVTGRVLAKLLNQHRLMVVPSVYQEPFGVVALEGIACGCVVLASHAGGLSEAVGPCGMTFPTGDAESLAESIHQLLRSPEIVRGFQAGAERHLGRHKPDKVAQEYLERLRNVNS